MLLILWLRGICLTGVSSSVKAAVSVLLLSRVVSDLFFLKPDPLSPLPLPPSRLFSWLSVFWVLRSWWCDPLPVSLPTDAKSAAQQSVGVDFMALCAFFGLSDLWEEDRDSTLAHIWAFSSIYRCDFSTTAGFKGHLKKHKGGDLHRKYLLTYQRAPESARCVLLLGTAEWPILTKSGTQSPFLFKGVSFLDWGVKI